MKKSRWLALIALLSAVMLLTAACGGDDDDEEAGNGGDGPVECTWVIGTMGALSGDNAAIGQPIFQGIEYAVDELNEAGELGCELTIQSEDSQGNPDQAPALAQSLVENEELVGIVGPYFSGETLATGEIFSSAGVAFVCPSCTAASIDDQGFETFFRAVADDDVQGEVAGQYLQSLGGDVAVIHDNQDYSKGLADAVAATLGDAAGPFIINPEEQDFSSVVQQVVDADPDLVFYGGYLPQAAPLAQQLQQAGVEATFVSDDGTKSADFGELAGDAAEGAQVTCPCVDPLEIPEAEAFVEGMNEEYGENPGTFAADAYDATYLMAEALKEADPEGDIEEVRATIVEFLAGASYEGIAKTYSFTDTGNLEIGPEGVYVYEWSDDEGDFVSLGPANELIE